jgi:hypothetical protein
VNRADAALQPCVRRLSGTAGASSSLAAVLLTPVLVVLSFAAFQAALWGHAKSEARAIARDTAALVARAGVVADAARESALRTLVADTQLRDPQVSVAVDAELVWVTVSGEAPGIVRGTAARVTVTAALPREGWIP